MSHRDEAIALLERSAARLDDTGWMRGEAGGLAGPNCLMGALGWEQGAGQDIAYRLAQRAWHNANQTNYSIIGWNDRFCEDGAQAADSLRMAAKWLASHVPADSD